MAQSAGFVSGTLMGRFRDAAGNIVARAASQDNGYVRVSDQYVRLQQGLAMLAKHMPHAVLEDLQSWREAAKKAATEGNNRGVLSSDLIVKRQLLAIEILYLEAVKSLLEQQVQIPDAHADYLQSLAFVWVTGSTASVQHEDLFRNRARVIADCVAILALLCQFRMHIIAPAVSKKVLFRLQNDAPANRNQISLLFQGMRSAQLQLASDGDVLVAMDLLSSLNPLNINVASKRSSMQHLICDFLTGLLRPAALSGNPHASRAQVKQENRVAFYKQTDQLLNDLLVWLQKGKGNKHYASGYPLITVLMCIVSQEATFDQQRMVDLITQRLHKLLRERVVFNDLSQRTLGLACLVQCVNGFLQHNAGRMSNTQLETQLDNFLTPVTAAARKGSLIAPEQLELLQQLCVQSMVHAPGYTLARLLPDLLSCDLWEVIIVALHAMLDIMQSAKQRLSETLSDAAVLEHCTHRVDADALKELALPGATPVTRPLDLIRRGSHPLVLYGLHESNHQRHLERLLGKLLTACLSVHSSRLSYARLAPVSESVQKSQALLLQGLVCLMQLTPFCEPSLCTNRDDNFEKVCESLASLTLHVDSNASSTAVSTLHSLMYCRPSSRNAITQATIHLMHRIPVEFSGSVLATMDLLVALMTAWMEHEQEDQARGTPERAGLPSAVVNVSLIEGFGLTAICNAVADIRKRSWDILICVRRLHRVCFSAAVASEREEPAMYAINVLEQIGDELAREHYWDFGMYSQLQRQYNEVSSDVTLLRVMGPFVLNDSLPRWSALLPQLLLHLSSVCPDSVDHAYAQITNHLVKNLKGDTRSLASICELPDNQRVQMWRAYVTFLAACPPSAAVGKFDRGEAPAILSIADLHAHLRETLLCGSDSHTQSSLPALGHCHTDHFRHSLPVLLTMYTETFQVGTFNPASKLARLGKSLRKEDLRLRVAHVLRIAAPLLPKGHLATDTTMADELTRFLTFTLKQVSGSCTPEAFWETTELRYCLCMVTEAVAEQTATTGASVLSSTLRRDLFLAFGCWAPEEFHSLAGKADDLLTSQRWIKMLTYGTSKLKDVETRTAMLTDMRRSMEALQLSAIQAMGALLTGPAWDASITESTGSVFTYLNTMLTTPEPPPMELLTNPPSRLTLAQRVLRRLLTANLDLFPACLNRCYSNEPVQARAYFHVFAEAFARVHVEHGDADVAPAHTLLALVLCKIVDPDARVRHDALELLHVVVEHTWGSKVADASGSTPRNTVVVIGHLQDSYQLFQLELSTRLAGEHPEVSQDLCLELLNRHLASTDGTVSVLPCLKPWLANITLNKKWEGTWTESFLSCLCVATLALGQTSSHDVQHLWQHLAAKGVNIEAIIDYVLVRGMHECNGAAAEQASLSVAKRIMLYLGQCSPQQTNDVLVSECKQLIVEEDVEPAPASDLEKLPIFEFEVQDAATLAASKFSSLALSTGYRSTSMRSRVAVLAGAGGDDQSHGGGASEAGDREVPPDFASRWSSAPLPNSPATSSPIGPSDSSITAHGPDVSLVRMASRGSHHMASTSLGSARSFRRAATATRTEQVTADGAVHRSSSIVGVPEVAMCRPELALCLLAELAYQHDEDFRPHLPVLLLVSVIKLDSQQPVVHKHARQVIINLLYSMSARHLEMHRGSSMADKYQRVTAIITELQASRDAPVWAHERTSLTHPAAASVHTLTRLVRGLMDSMFFEPELGAHWATESLSWAMHIPCAFLATRSLQVFRALSPPLSPEICFSLLSALQLCLQHPSSASYDFAAEVLLTLIALVDATPAQQLKMYPQLLWGAVAMLHTTYVPLFRLVLRLLHSLLSTLNLWNLPCQQVLQAASFTSPAALGVLDLEPWTTGCALLGMTNLTCIQQLLFKGLLHDDTRSLTISLLTQLLRQVGSCLRTRGQTTGIMTFQPGLGALASGGLAALPAVRGMDALFGICSHQLTTSILAGIPWVLSQRGSKAARPEVAAFCTAAADACTAFGAAELAPRLSAFAADATDVALPNLLSNFARAFIAAFFPAHAGLTLVYCVLMLLAGPPASHDAHLHLVKALFQVGNMDLGPFQGSDAHVAVVRTLTLLAEGGHSSAVLQVIDAMLAQMSSAGSEEVAKGLGAADAADPPLPPGVLPIAEPLLSSQLAAESLQKCVASLISSSATSLGSARSRSRLLPFIQSGALDFSIAEA